MILIQFNLCLIRVYVPIHDTEVCLLELNYTRVEPSIVVMALTFGAQQK